MEQSYATDSNGLTLLDACRIAAMADANHWWNYAGDALAVPTVRIMNLQRPTDFRILEALYLYGRNVAPNVAIHTDKERRHINTRLPMLADYGLVEKVGPAERSGVYQLTTRGLVAMVLRDRYDSAEDFDALIEAHLDNVDDSWIKSIDAAYDRVGLDLPDHDEGAGR